MTPYPVQPQGDAELAAIRDQMRHLHGNYLGYHWARHTAGPDEVRRLTVALLYSAGAPDATAALTAAGLFEAATGRVGTAGELAAFFAASFFPDALAELADPDVAAGFAAGVLEGWDWTERRVGPAA
jgi:hypothetical protein